MREGREQRDERERRRSDSRGTAVTCLWTSIISLLLCAECILVPVSAHAASLSGDIKAGNRYYKQRDYDKALEQYEAAGEESPDLDIVNFNKGTAYYQKGQYQKAIDSFTKALNTEDKETESDAIYNIANAKYKLGRANAENNINSAVSLYRESLDYYKRAIELDEGSRDAKYNHELVERELKVLLDKLKNQQQGDQEKKQDKDKKEEQKSDMKDSQSNEAKKEERQQGQEARDDQEMKDDKGRQQAAEEDAGQEQQTGRQDQKDSGMSPEEAKMLLEAFSEEEAREAGKRQKGAHYPEVLKDW